MVTNPSKDIYQMLKNLEKEMEKDYLQLRQLSKINNVYFIYKNSPKLLYHLVLY